MFQNVRLAPFSLIERRRFALRRQIQKARRTGFGRKDPRPLSQELGTLIWPWFTKTPLLRLKHASTFKLLRRLSGEQFCEDKYLLRG